MQLHKYSTAELVAQKASPAKFKKLPRTPIVFILHNIRSLENVGLFFRLADAVRAEKIYLTGYTGYPPLPAEALAKAGLSQDPREPRIISHAEKEINRTAIKLVPFVPWDKNEDVNKVISDLKTQKYQLVGVEQTNKSVDYTKAGYRLPIALVFGHERTGIEEEILSQCDLIVHIPMLGMGNSHNVAVSAAIISHHILTRNAKL